MADSREFTGVIFKCVQCGNEITQEQLSLMLEIKCPACGYRVLRKTRPPIVKRLKAR
jgi:DNA-directed RNA polymerase subunit P